MSHHLRLLAAFGLAVLCACTSPRDPGTDDSTPSDGGAKTDAGQSGPPKPTCTSNGPDAGVSCNCPDGWLIVDENTCADVDECARNNGGCSEHAACANTPGSRLCKCDQGYVGNGETCGREGGGHAITIDPTSLTYGIVASGFPVSRFVNVSNILVLDPQSPRDALILTSVDVPTDVAVILPQGKSFPLTIDPNTQVTVELRFDPTKSAFLSGTADFHSNDLERAVVSVTLEGEGRVLAPCALTLNASETAGLQFGAVAPGQQGELNLALRNTGSSECILQELKLDAPMDTPFSLGTTVAAGTVIATGSALETKVLFAPPANAPLGTPFTGNVVVTVSSTTKPVTRIPLTGTVGQPCLQLSPRQLDFGTATPNCGTKAQRVTLTNTCSTAVTISNIAETGGRGVFVLAGSSPTSVAAKKTAALDLQYVPTSQGSDSSYLVLSTTETGLSSGAYKVGLQGQAVAFSPKSAEFDQGGSVDMLFVVDDSGSMGDKQAALASALSAFFAALGSIDYRLAVTTTGTDSDQYCLPGPETINGQFMPQTGADRIITTQTVDPATVFARNVSVGTNGCAVEQGLEGAYRALTEPNLSGTNAGFLRSDAFLSVVVVTDAEDQSPNPVDFYKDYFTTLKGSLDNFSVNVIADTDPALCSMTGVYTEGSGGARYMSIAQATGGISRSICSTDWTTIAQDLATNAHHQRTSFVLPEEAGPSGMSVTVNGGLVQQGTDWNYDSTHHAIIFTQAPAEGSHIAVTYAPACY